MHFGCAVSKRPASGTCFSCACLGVEGGCMYLEALSNPSFSGSVKASWHVATFIAFILQERKLHVAAWLEEIMPAKCAVYFFF